MNTNPIKIKENILDELKRYYKEGLVSALIGAGFSKNVSDSFLGWGELLHDMVGEVYAIEFNRYYEKYLQLYRGASTILKSEEKVKDEFISEKIQEDDYLELVSKYIKKKGIRESVETYIESRTPYATFDLEKKIVLKIRDKEKESVFETKFSAHKELLLLDKLQNIYTTNYENLIEFTIDLMGASIPNLPNIVRNGRDLSDKIRSRNVIKIHGDLRQNSNGRINFDGDNKLQYIIAKEDYDTYKEKHEAFTSLMRIAMLQGKFMLLGFSGTDANYKGWVTWVSDVLEGENDDVTKIYIIDVSGKDIPLDLQLHYNNHHTKVIDLIVEERLRAIGFNDNEVVSILQKQKDEKLDNDIKRTVLTKFLSFLRTSLSESDEFVNDGGQSIQEVTDKENENDYSNDPAIETKPLETTLINAKQTSYDYRKLWGEASSKIDDIDSIDDIVKRIQDAKPQNRFPKIVSDQESVTFGIMRKSKLNDKDAFLFALAVDELGLNPHYYSQVVQDYEELNKSPLWNLLKIKESTFNGDDSMLQDDADECVYENIQRNLFHLDFDKANDLVENWSPGNDFVVQKAMRLATIKEHRDEARALLSNYIEEEKNIVRQMYAMQIANYISGQYPRPYNMDDFFKFGIDGIGDILNYMVQQLRGKIEKPNARGYIGTTMNLGGGNPNYEKSLRILRFISDSGIYVNYGFTYMFDIASWYLVFQNLYKEFPYPCFFYSIQYNDNSVLTRIGQDFAYSPELSDFNKDILIRSLNAMGYESMPVDLVGGLLRVTGPIYMAVDEEVWFGLFKENVFDKLINNYDKLNISAPLIKNVGDALVSLKKHENIVYVLSALLSHYRENHRLTDILIRDNLHIKYIKNIPYEIEDILIALIREYPNNDITELMYVLDKEGQLAEKIKCQFIKRVSEIDSDELPQELALSLYLCLLCKNDPETLKKAKTKLLSHNIWHCGVMENGKGWSAPNYLRLNVLKGEIEWTDDEFKCICENLKSNIQRFNEANDMLVKSPFGRNIQTRYLSDVLLFIDGQNDERKELLIGVRKKAERLLQNRVSYKNLIEGMLSEQSADIDGALDNVMCGIDAQGLSAYLNEFNFILDKAIIGEGTTINRTLELIRCVVNDYPKEIVELQLCSKLHTLLSIYKDRWTQLREFKPVWSFNYLYKIAEFLKEKDRDDSETVNYWLSDSFVQRFIRN
ncbi:MAG: SIR2 family protein [Bacteroidales bacterium]|nr:SIR2 family protein [Bacteroidales bacterium]